jgi:hypothetical protein
MNSAANPNGQKLATSAPGSFQIDFQNILMRTYLNDLLLTVIDVNVRFEMQQNDASNSKFGSHDIEHTNMNKQPVVDICAANNRGISKAFLKYKCIHVHNYLHMKRMETEDLFGFSQKKEGKHNSQPSAERHSITTAVFSSCQCFSFLKHSF